MSLSQLGLNEKAIIMLFLLCSVGGLILLLIFTTLYFAKAYAIHDILKKAEQKYKWFAFIPFFSSYATGKAAELYVGKKDRNAAGSAVFLTFLSVVKALLFFLTVCFGVIGSIRLLFAADAAVEQNKQAALDALPQESYDLFTAAVILCFVFVFFAFIYRIFSTVCLFRIYSIFSYRKAPVLAIFSFFFAFLTPFFLLSICKNEPVYRYIDRFRQSSFQFN